MSELSTIHQMISLEKEGKVQEALALAGQALGNGSDNKQLLMQAATLASKVNQHKLCAQYLGQALSLEPQNGAIQYEYALALSQSDQHQAAEVQIAALVERNPREFKYLNLYGVILKRQGRFEEAIPQLIQASKLKPGHVSPWVNLGNIFIEMKTPQRAVESFNRAIKVAPRDGENYRLLGRAYSQSGQHKQALASLQKAVMFAPRSSRVRTDLAWTYYELREFEKAVEVIDKALPQMPGDDSLLRCKGMILRKLGRLDEAIGLYKGLLEKNPNDVETLVRLGNLYYGSLDQREVANEFYARAVALKPNDDYALAQYIDCLRNSRHGSEQEHLETAYRLGCRLLEFPSAKLEHASVLQTIFLRTAAFEQLNKLADFKALLNYWVKHRDAGALHNQLGRIRNMDDRLALVDAHRGWGKQIEDIAARNPVKKPTTPRHNHKIRIGFLSSDLRNHPVGYFTLPILEFYDKERFEIFCYSCWPREADPMQQHISNTVDKFRVFINASDVEIAQEIANDQLDILFELGGSTHMNRLEVMAYKPAPVQVSWLGYPHSCGLSTIDYILTDPYLTPEDERLLIEKPFILPETWVTVGEQGFRTDREVLPGLPEQRRGYFTFGTMNNPYKYTPACIATWAEILKRVENSRFLFVRPEAGTETFRQNISHMFAQHGITADRLEFIAIRGDHLPYYNDMDISLDPFPHVGGTNTCEAMWMGVPVVTLVGEAFFERLSYSNLNNAGLGDLCAFTIDDYIEKALTLANDPQRRAELRTGLRQQIYNHPLGQPERFVRNFEQTVIKTLDTHGR